MEPIKVVEFVGLLALANGSPIFATKLFGQRWAYPVDGHLRFVDGRRFFGPSKTLRGVVLATLVTAGGAAYIGVGWLAGALLGCSAMGGDLCSSFVKRRLGMAPSSKALGLDQIPEALFPVIVCQHWFHFTGTEIAVIIILFFVGSILLSQILFAVGLRNQPY